MLEEADKLKPWIRKQIPHEKRKYPHPMLHEARIELHSYHRDLPLLTSGAMAVKSHPSSITTPFLLQ